jgi:hypothetical protein
VVKLPRRPPEPLPITEDDLTDWPAPLMVRIHGTVGPHALPWYRLRHHGPTRTRFDPHPEPAGDHPDAAVLYAGATVDTAVAEVFQAGRVVERTAPNAPYLTIWQPVRRLQLLDIRGQWPVRAGASHLLNTGPHPVCRRWARAIALHELCVDGILYDSAMTGGAAVALFLPAADSFPDHPELSLPLSDPGLVTVLAGAAARIGYVLG